MKKIKQTQILNYLLYAGGVYFFLVAFVHSVGIKIPGLFVYYNVPSYAYQDHIISFLAFGWSVFFFIAARRMDTGLVKAILFIGLVAIIALMANTIVSDFDQMDTAIEEKYFWIIILGLFVYWLSLLISSQKLIKGENDKN